MQPEYPPFPPNSKSALAGTINVRAFLGRNLYCNLWGKAVSNVKTLIRLKCGEEKDLGSVLYLGGVCRPASLGGWVIVLKTILRGGSKPFLPDKDKGGG